MTKLEAKSQIFWLGVKGGPSFIWFNSPKFYDALVSEGYGWNIAVFAKYGKRPYFQVEADWTRAEVNLRFQFADITILEGKVAFHNFDLPVKVGYEIISRAKVKWRADAGPFIGTTFIFSSNDFEFERDDFRNPHFGVVAGSGIQFYNFVFSANYSYQITELFKGDDELGYNLGAHLQIISLKLGIMF